MVGIVREETEIAPTIGGPATIVDGFSVAFSADEEKTAGITLPLDLRIQEVTVAWENCKVGDRGWLVIENEPVACNPVSALDIGDTLVTLPSAVAPYYDPLAGARFIEFWNSTGTDIIEVRKIASRDGDVITLDSQLEAAHGTDAILRCIIQAFSMIRGSMGLEGGFHMLGTGVLAYGYEYEQTSTLPAGIGVRGRFKATSEVADRGVAVNFKFRAVNGS